MLKPGGRLAFFTIWSTTRLSAAQRRHVGEARGLEVFSKVSPSELMRTAGFVNIEEVDVTSAYLRTTRAFERAWRRRSDVARPLDPEKFDNEQRWRRMSIESIERGWIKRSLIVGRRPDRR